MPDSWSFDDAFDEPDQSSFGAQFENSFGDGNSFGRSVTPTPWFQHPALVVVSMVFCGPFSLVLIWLKQSWSTTVKIVLSVLIVGLSAVGGFAGATAESPADTIPVSFQEPDQPPAASATSTTSSSTSSSTTTTKATTTTTTVVPSTTTPATSAPQTSEAFLVTAVIDGDTIDVNGGTRVRLIGIDTPERGQCGYNAATAALAGLVAGRRVALIGGARDDTDRYGRLLRYVEVDNIDVNLAMINMGHAIARYDGLDGYGRHPRQDEYRSADAASPTAGGGACDQPPTTSPSVVPITPGGGGGGGNDAYYANCSDARRSGVTPLYLGQPGYRPALDGDKDGVACE